MANPIKLSVLIVAVGLGVVLPTWLFLGQVDREFKSPAEEAEFIKSAKLEDAFLCRVPSPMDPDSDAMNSFVRVKADPTKEPKGAKGQAIRSEATRVTIQPSYEKCHGKKYRPLTAFNDEKNTYSFGRYASALESMNHQKDLTSAQKFSQWKQFMWNAVTDGEWFLGLALLEFGYNGGAAILAYNHKTGQSYHRQIELPLVLNNLFGPKWTGATHKQKKTAEEEWISSPNGCITLSEMLDDTFLQTCAMPPDPKTFVIYRNVTISLHIYDDLAPYAEPVFLRADWKYPIANKKGLDTMNVVFPVGPRRASLVSKGAGIPSLDAASSSPKVKFSLGGVTHEMKEGEAVSMFDYTRGLLRRLTIWKWMAINVPASRLVLDDLGSYAVKSDMIKQSYGMQLSVGTYDVKNTSVESSVSVDGEMHPFEFDDVKYEQLEPELPSYVSKWRVTGGHGALDLLFTPCPTPGARWQGNFHYGILDGDLFHMYGTYTGLLPVAVLPEGVKPGTPRTLEWRSVQIKDGGAPGVLEDHYALW